MPCASLVATQSCSACIPAARVRFLPLECTSRRGAVFLVPFGASPDGILYCSTPEGQQRFLLAEFKSMFPYANTEGLTFNFKWLGGFKQPPAPPHTHTTLRSASCRC